MYKLTNKISIQVDIFQLAYFCWVMSKTQNGKKALLLWAQKILQDYPNVDMKDFSLSWRDGIAFLGILHFYLGEEKVPGVNQLKPHTNERENLNRAFGISTKLGIDQFMDTEGLS
jgi:hypothetical protein